MNPTTRHPASDPCGLLRRLAAMLYDGLVVIALLMTATALVMLLGFREVSALQDPLYTLLLLLTWFLYLAWFWRNGGMTLGMRAWRVRILDIHGQPPGWGRCALRFFTSFISAATAGLGFAWALIDSEKRCWHDLASGTRLSRT